MGRVGAFYENNLSGEETSGQNPSLEENFAALDKIIEKLSSENISLEEAFQVYSTGMSVLKSCNEQIDRVEKKVLKISEEGKLEER